MQGWGVGLLSIFIPLFFIDTEGSQVQSVKGTRGKIKILITPKSSITILSSFEIKMREFFNFYITVPRDVK